MNELVVLSLGNGDLRKGFETITARLWEPGNPHPIQFTGSLPAAPDLIELYKHWQLLYSALYAERNLSLRIKISAADIKNVSKVEFSDLCQGLSNRINNWFSSESFRNIEQQLRTHLQRKAETRFIIETNDNLLRRLPWHLWKFFEDYPNAEIALSAPQYERVIKLATEPPGTKVKILAVLGNSKGIDIKKDRAFLEQLSAQAEVKFLVEPELKQLNDQLWEEGWDILFFAGHSSSREKGLIQLNRTDSLTLDQVRYALKKTISRGLKLAIFNSCDGLGLAQELVDLQIPQIVVMREPVPDRVAQEFLRYFLSAFSSGQSLYASVRFARERLQLLEREYPCATWLPVICQNPAEMPTSWQDWCASKEGNVVKQRTRQQNRASLPSRSYLTVAIWLVMVTAVIMGLRHLGILQSLELQAFDYLIRQRPDELPDPRLLVVTVTEDDLQLPQQQQRKGSLSDTALNQLLQKLEQYKPRVIGLDIYRDFPVETGQKDLANRLRQSENIVAVCKASDASINVPGVASPPEVPTERLGFSDFITDPDGVLRRHLLSMDVIPASPCTTPYAFSIQLAFRYLAAQGYLPKYTPSGILQIGSTTIKPLETRTGGYQTIDAWGYQLLLNYRSPRSLENIAQTVTLAQVLNNQVKPNDIKDRIVLIGTTAESFRDYWKTPYSGGSSSAQELTGVLAQGQMVSQILSTVLDKRPLLWAYPQWIEIIWVFGWSVVGGILAMGLKSPLHLGLAVIGGYVCLYGICFGLLLQNGCWVPFVPATLALLATIVSVTTYTKFIARS